MKKVLIAFAAIAASMFLAVSCGTKVDHSSAKAVVESFLNAVNDGNVDAMIECLDMTDYAKEADTIRKNAEKYCERKKGTIHDIKVESEPNSMDWLDYEYVDDKGDLTGSLQVTKVDGKWYIVVRSTGLNN